MPGGNLWEGVKGPFPEPRADTEFQRHFEKIETKRQGVFDYLSTLETSISFEHMENCLLSFVRLLEALEECAKHPADLDRMLKDKSLIDDITSMLKAFEQYNLVDTFRHSIPSGEASTIKGRRWSALASIAERGIVQAEFYVGLARKEQHG